MNETKPWWMSRAILGGVTAASAGALSQSVGSTDAAAVIGFVFGMSAEDAADIVRLLTDLATIGGGMLAVYGRVKATRPIGRVTPPDPE